MQIPTPFNCVQEFCVLANHYWFDRWSRHLVHFPCVVCWKMWKRFWGLYLIVCCWSTDKSYKTARVSVYVPVCACVCVYYMHIVTVLASVSVNVTTRKTIIQWMRAVNEDACEQEDQRIGSEAFAICSNWNNDYISLYNFYSFFLEPNSRWHNYHSKEFLLLTPSVAWSSMSLK